MSKDSSSHNRTPTHPLADFSKELELRDGTRLKLRSLRQTDKDGLKALFHRLSPESIRYRFLSTIKTLPDELLDRLLNVDGATQVALVVTFADDSNPRILAVGRYNAIPERPQVAEVAFLVEDEFQKRGIGTLLLHTLATIASEHGITHFSADVLVDNLVMLSVFRKAGYALTSSASFGVTHLEFPLRDDETERQKAFDL